MTSAEDSKGTSRKKIMFAADRHPWEKQPAETAIQYARFLRFRNIGRSRSLIKVHNLLTEIDDEIQYTTIVYYSHIFRWYERAEAWDIEEQEKEAEEYAQIKIDALLRHLEIANKLREKALLALEYIEEFTPRDIVQFVKISTDLERLAIAGLTQEEKIAENKKPQIGIDDGSDLTPEERQARMIEIISELARRNGLKVSPIDTEDK